MNIKEPSFSKWKPSWKGQVLWTVANLILIALVFRWGSEQKVFNFPVQKDVPWWTPLAGPAATALSAFVVYKVFLGNRDLQQRHFEETRKQERDHRDQSRRDQELYFERKELQDTLRDISDRFANKDSSLIRANAASRLADLAQRRTEFDPANSYSMFGSAAAQLAAALVFEPDDNVRGEVVDALGRMARFCESAQEPRLLRVLIDETAESNKRILAGFIKAFAEYESTSTGQHVIEYLTPICSSKEVIKSCLSSIRESREYGWEKTSCGFNKNKVQPEKDFELADALTKWSLKLAHSRDALAKCLASSGSMPIKDTMTDLDEINLDRCFLGGASMMKAHLKGASIQHSYFNGAWLLGANMRDAELNLSHFQNCGLIYAAFDRARWWDTRFDGAKLQGAYLHDINVMETKRPLFQYQVANWWMANFCGSFSKREDQSLLRYFQDHWPRPEEDPDESDIEN
jgi:hypothetical protein